VPSGVPECSDPPRRWPCGPTGGDRRGDTAPSIHVTAITRGANREEAAIEPAAFLAKRRVDDVGASGRSDWTRTSNRGTRDTTDSVRRSIEAVTEGLEVLRPDPHLTLSASVQRTRRPGRPRLSRLTI